MAIQSGIDKAFMGDWHDWMQAAPWKNILLRVLPHTLFYPITSLVYLFSFGRYCKSYNSPKARYMTYFMSYIVFLILLFGITQDYLSMNIRGFAVTSKFLRDTTQFRLSLRGVLHATNLF